MAQYQHGQVITSATGQLQWDAAGVITIDTPGTQGMVGFAQGQLLKLHDITITSAGPTPRSLLTAEDRTASLADALCIW